MTWGMILLVALLGLVGAVAIVAIAIAVVLAGFVISVLRAIIDR